MQLIRFEAAGIFTIATIPADEAVLDLGVIDGSRYYAITQGITPPREAEVLAPPVAADVANAVWRQSPYCRAMQASLVTEPVRRLYTAEEEMQAMREGDETYLALVAECKALLATRRAELGL